MIQISAKDNTTQEVYELYLQLDNDGAFANYSDNVTVVSYMNLEKLEGQFAIVVSDQIFKEQQPFVSI